MGLNGGSLGFGFILWAKDAASHVIKAVERNVKNLGDTTEAEAKHIKASFKEVAKAAGVLTAGLVPLAGAIVSASAAGEFTQGLAAVGAATGATAREMRGLHDAALAAGIATQYAPAEAVQGLIALATAGQTATQAMGTLKHSLDLAAASLGQLDVSQASDALGGTLTAWSMSTDKAGEVTDKLVQATMLTNFQAADFSVGLSRVAEAGARYNQSLDDVLIGMGLLRNRNINAEVAATALRAAITRVNSDLNAQKLLLQQHIPLLDAYTGKERSILDILTEFAEVTRGMSPLRLNNMVKEIFGEEGMPAFSSVAAAMFTSVEDGISTTYRGAEAIAALRGELANAGGAASKFVERYNDNFRGQMVLLRGTVSALFVTIGEVFGDLLKPAVSFITEGFRRILDLLMALPMPLKHVAGAAFLLASAFVAIAGAAALMTRSLGFIKIAASGALAAIGPTIAGLVGALATPVGLAVAAVVASLGLLYAAYRTNVGGMAKLVGSGPGPKMLTFWRGLSQLMEDGTLRGGVLKSLNDSAALKQFTLGVYAVVSSLRALWNGVKYGFAGAMTALSETFTVFGTALGSTGSSLLNLFGALGRLLRIVFILLRPVFWVMGALIGGLAAGLTAALTRTVEALMFGLDVVLSLGSAVNAVLDAMAAVWNANAVKIFCDAIVRMLPDALQRAWHRVRSLFGSSSKRRPLPNSTSFYPGQRELSADTTHQCGAIHPRVASGTVAGYALPGDRRSAGACTGCNAVATNGISGRRTGP